MRTAGRVVAVAILAATVACASDAPRVIIHSKAGPRPIAVEVVDTPASRDRGLMYRRTLADGAGMLFVFDEEAEHAFWMKNTFIPLDMIFVSQERRVVGVHVQVRPHSLTPVGGDPPSRWVIEVPGGWAARMGIAVGDRVEIPAGR